MIDSALKDRLLEQLERLSPEQLARVSAYAHALAVPLPRGASVEDLVRLARAVDDDSARQMTAAIEEAFERVEPGEW